jgi:ATP sulfurylase
LASDDKFFNDLIRGIGLQLFVSAPARVVSVNGSRADVKILFKFKDKEGNIQEHSVIQGARILKHVGPINVGDVVHLNFTDRALDNLNGNQTFDPGYTRIHSINDAVIVGVYQL